MVRTDVAAGLMGAKRTRVFMTKGESKKNNDVNVLGGPNGPLERMDHSSKDIGINLAPETDIDY
jgi:hypothetical protein